MLAKGVLIHEVWCMYTLAPRRLIRHLPLLQPCYCGSTCTSVSLMSIYTPFSAVVPHACFKLVNDASDCTVQCPHGNVACVLQGCAL